jgi:hypothetical protein
MHFGRYLDLMSTSRSASTGFTAILAELAKPTFSPSYLDFSATSAEQRAALSSS